MTGFLDDGDAAKIRALSYEAVLTLRDSVYISTGMFKH